MAVTLRALAAHLGLTVGTVSRALNGYADISPATRDRVRKAADELGYRPNQNARRLSKGTPDTVCYLMPRQMGTNVQPFVAELLAGLSAALNARSWDLIVAQEDTQKSDLAKIDQMVRSGRISGMVLSRPFKNDPRIELLQKLRCPFVVHGRTAACDNYAWYDVDSQDAFVSAVNHLVQLGHRDIAFIGAPLQYEFAQQRLDGYLRGLSHNGLQKRPDFIQVAEFTDQGGEVAAAMLRDLDHPPSAIVCVSDVMAFGALAALNAKGLKPGVDVSLIGYDGVHFARHSNPPLTTLVQPQAHAGHRLGDMILALADGADPKTQQELRRAQLVRRQTDGPPPGKRPMTDVSEREEFQ